MNASPTRSASSACSTKFRITCACATGLPSTVRVRSPKVSRPISSWAIKVQANQPRALVPVPATPNILDESPAAEQLLGHALLPLSARRQLLAHGLPGRGRGVGRADQRLGEWRAELCLDVRIRARQARHEPPYPRRRSLLQ